MAKFLAGYLLSDVRGSVGSVCVKGVRGGLSLQRRAGGRVRSREASDRVSRTFAEASVRWGGLGGPDRLAWDCAAGGVGLGRNLFMRVVFRRFHVGGIWDFSVPVSGRVGSMLGVSLSASASGPSAVVSWVTDSSDVREDLGMWYGVFASRAAGEPCSGWKGPLWIGEAPSGSVDLGAALAVGMDVLQVGRSVGVRCAVWNSRVGKMSGALAARCIVGA